MAFYGNTATNCTGYRWINQSRQLGLFFNNIVTGRRGYACRLHIDSGSVEVHLLQQSPLTAALAFGFLACIAN